MKHIAYKRKPLGNKRFKWKQREFTLSTFNCVAEDMDKMIRNCIDAGLNLLELGWASHEKAWEAVEMCEKHGIDLIFQDFSLFGGMMHYHDGREVTEEDIRRVVEKLRNKKHVIGYYIWDEPNRDYLMKEARRQSDIFNKYAPDALLFFVFVPSNNGQLNWENGKYAESFEEYPDKWTALLGTGEKGEFFEQQKKIHREFKMLGNTLMALNNRAVYHSSDLMPFGKYGEIYKRYEDNIADSKLLAGELLDRTSVGELYDDFGNDYLFVLNRDFYMESLVNMLGKKAYPVK